MNVLFVGSGSGGSWQIRGVQIGRALDARVTSHPITEDWSWADVVVLVKHAITLWGEAAANAAGVRLIWDVLDFWKQPQENTAPISDIVKRVQRLKRDYRIETVIGATQAMADEIGGVYVPHHSRPGYDPRHSAVRDRIRTIAYEGTPKYLGQWRKVCEQLATTIHAEFVVNPPSLHGADLIVAFRGDKWDGPLCRRWKSGVKLANAVACGRPVITQRTEAFFEMGPCGAMVEDPSELRGMVEVFASVQARRDVLQRSYEIAPDFTLETTVKRYRHLCEQVMRRAA